MTSRPPPNTVRCWLAALAVIALPFALYPVGLSLNTGTMVVALAIADDGAQPLHRLHRAGIVRSRRLVRHRRLCGGADPAQLVQQRHLSAAAARGDRCRRLSTFVGIVILRRRGVYFSLLTLALSALTYTIAFRWTAVTGGEDGLGGLKRGSIGPSASIAR